MSHYTDTQRMDWLSERLTYLEHKSADGTQARDTKQGNYWPQSMDPNDNPCDTAIEEFADLSLDDYVDAMLDMESKQ